MNPRIENFPQTIFVGKKARMSFANDQTHALWQDFMPSRVEISNVAETAFYSIEVYDDLSFFDRFDPTREFEKWAAISVNSIGNLPENMESIEVPAGSYAVFHYKGKPSEAGQFIGEIYNNWLPNSAYVLEHRPHFARMDERYKGEHPDSEEEFWIPVRKK